MKDIDFDELDRAVNSLINPDGTPTVADNSSLSTTVPVVSNEAVATPTSPLAERRSSGRFMDVVHPSSDMRGSVAPRPMQPISVQQQPVVQTEPQQDSTISMPDPIDEGSSAITGAEPDNSSEPLESPFLADAKVEKRPLGAFSNEVHDSSPTMPASNSAIIEPDLESLSLDSPIEVTSKSSDQPVDSGTPLPAELQTDVLSIEANEDSVATKAEEPVSMPDTTPIGPTSITPQYTQQPSTGDKPAGNIFATEAYKKPQVVKVKKSGLFIILWIFLLLVVGAGIGAAVYFFVLPKL